MIEGKDLSFTQIPDKVFGAVKYHIPGDWGTHDIQHYGPSSGSIPESVIKIRGVDAKYNNSWELVIWYKMDVTKMTDQWDTEIGADWLSFGCSVWKYSGERPLLVGGPTRRRIGVPSYKDMVFKTPNQIVQYVKLIIDSSSGPDSGEGEPKPEAPTLPRISRPQPSLVTASVDCAIDSLIVEDEDTNYFGIGHRSASRDTILWQWMKGKIDSISVAEVKKRKGYIDSGESYVSHYEAFGNVDPFVSGRVDLKTLVGSISVSSRAEDHFVRKALDELVAEFPGVRFIVYAYGPDNSVSLSKYYQTLGESAIDSLLEGPYYTDIGHYIELKDDAVVLWKWENGSIKARTRSEVRDDVDVDFRREVTHTDAFDGPFMIYGRVDLGKMEGSIYIRPNVVDGSIVKRAINELVDKFSGVRFSVFTSGLGGNAVGAPLSKYYQTLGESDLYEWSTYISIGHGEDIEDAVVLWVWDGSGISTKSMKDVKREYSDIEFPGHAVVIGWEDRMYGRVDLAKKIGSIAFISSPKDQEIVSAINALIGKFPGIQFFVYDKDRADLYGAPLSKYYQTLGESDLYEWESYLDVGHGRDAILWVWNGSEIESMSTEEAERIYKGEDSLSHHHIFPGGYSALGRVDLEKMVGSIYIKDPNTNNVNSVSDKEMIDIIDALIYEFSGVRFLVFDETRVDVYGAPLSKYYQTLGESSSKDIVEGKDVPSDQANWHFFKAAELTIGGEWYSSESFVSRDSGYRAISGRSKYYAYNVIHDSDFFAVDFSWALKQVKNLKGGEFYDSEFGDNNFVCSAAVKGGASYGGAGRLVSSYDLATPLEAVQWVHDAMKELSSDSDDDPGDEKPEVDPTPEPSVGVPVPSLIGEKDMDVDKVIDRLVSEGLPVEGDPIDTDLEIDPTVIDKVKGTMTHLNVPELLIVGVKGAKYRGVYLGKVMLRGEYIGHIAVAKTLEFGYDSEHYHTIPEDLIIPLEPLAKKTFPMFSLD